LLVQRLIAATAVVVIPVALIGAEPPRKAPGDSATRKICEIQGTTGSRLGTTRVCRTKSERDATKAEARRVAERIQNMRADGCPPYC
jgi:hypothetical protein